MHKNLKSCLKQFHMKICHIICPITTVIPRYHHSDWAPTTDLFVLCSFKERNHFYVHSRAVDDPSLPQTSVRCTFARTQERNRITVQSQAALGRLPAQPITRTTYGSIQVCCSLALKGQFTQKLKLSSFTHPHIAPNLMTCFLKFNSKGEILNNVQIW